MRRVETTARGLTERRFAAAAVLFALLLAAGCGTKGSNYPLPRAIGSVEGNVYVASYNAMRAAGQGAPSGTVPLAGAKVEIAALDASATTDANGYFKLDELKSGTYTLTISKAGFATISMSVSVPGAYGTTNINTANPDMLTMSPSGATGTLTITAVSGATLTVPVEAAITIDGIATGKTTSPVAYYTNVRVGAYSVNATLAGYTSDGPKTANVTAGQIATMSFRMTPADNNYPPLAAIITPIDNLQAAQGTNITFSGRGADTEDGNLTGASLVWTSDVDGQIGTGETFTKNNLTVATHMVTLAATDKGGKTGKAYATLVVQAAAGPNTAPQAAIISPANGAAFNQGATATFNGLGLDTEDGALTGTSLVWSSSLDGQIGTGVSFTKKTLSAGQHAIVLTATDSGGRTGTANITITVHQTAAENAAPTATIVTPANNASVAQGATATFTGAGVDPEQGVLTGTSLVWTSSRDGQIGTGAALQYKGLSLGTHTISLTATDNAGLSGVAAITLTVTAAAANTQPTAVITTPAVGTAILSGQAILFTGYGTDIEDTAIPGSMPSEYQYQFTDQGNQLSQVKFSQGNTKRTLVLKVFVPDTLSAAKLNKPFGFFAAVGSENTMTLLEDRMRAAKDRTIGAAELQAMKVGFEKIQLTPRGTGKVDLTFSNLYYEKKIGEEIRTKMTVDNTGSVDLSNIRFKVEKPLDWQVRLSPASVDALAPDDDTDVQVTITPPANTDVGAYEVKILAECDVRGTTVQTDQKTIRIQLAAKTNLTGNLILVGVLVAAIIGIAVFTVKLSRR